MSNDPIQVSIDEATFRRMQALSEPLIDTVSSVIGRLLDAYEANSQAGAAGLEEDASASETTHDDPTTPPITDQAGIDDAELEGRLSTLQQMMEQPPHRHGREAGGEGLPEGYVLSDPHREDASGGSLNGQSADPSADAPSRANTPLMERLADHFASEPPR